MSLFTYDIISIGLCDITQNGVQLYNTEMKFLK